MNIDIHEQQDAVELLQKFLDLIPNEQKEAFIINEIQQNQNRQQYNFLQLHVKGNKDLKQAIQNYKEEQKSQLIFSDTIMFNINRQYFDQKSFHIIKDDTDFKYPSILTLNTNNIQDLVCCGQIKRRYILSFLIVHNGTAAGGHYYVYKLNLQSSHHYQSIKQLKNQQWYKITDAKVCKVTQKEVMSCRQAKESAVLLVYESVHKYLNEDVIRMNMVQVPHERIQLAKETLKQIQYLSKTMLKLHICTNQNIIENRGTQISFTDEKIINIDQNTILSDFINKQQVDIKQICLITKKYQLKSITHYDKYITINDLQQQDDILKYYIFISKYQKRIFLSVLQCENKIEDDISRVENLIVQLGEVELNDQIKNNIENILQEKQYFDNNESTTEKSIKYYLHTQGNIVNITDNFESQLFNNCQIMVQIGITDYSSNSSQELKQQYPTQYSPKIQQIHTIPQLFRELQKRINITFKIMPDAMIEAHKQSIRLIQLTFGGFNLKLYPQFLRRYQKELKELKNVNDIFLQVRETDTLQSLMQEVRQQIDQMDCFVFQDNSVVKYGEVLKVLQYPIINKDGTQEIQQNKEGVVFMSNIQCNGRQLFVQEPLQVLSYIKKEGGKEKYIGQYLKIENTDTGEADSIDQSILTEQPPKLNSQRVNTWVFEEQQSIFEGSHQQIQNIKQKDDEYIIYYRIPLVNYKLLQYKNVVRVVLVRQFHPLIDLYPLVSRNINQASSDELIQNINNQISQFYPFFEQHQKIKVKLQLSIQSIYSDKLVFVNTNQLLSELRGTPMQQRLIFRCDFIQEDFDQQNLSYILLKDKKKYHGYPLIYDQSKYQTKEQIIKYIQDSVDYHNQMKQFVKDMKPQYLSHTSHKFRNYFIHSKIQDIQWDQCIEYVQEKGKYCINCEQFTEVYRDIDQVKLQYSQDSKEIKEFLL